MNVPHFIHSSTILLDISCLKCRSVLSQRDPSADLWSPFPPSLSLSMCEFTSYLVCNQASFTFLNLGNYLSDYCQYRFIASVLIVQIYGITFCFVSAFFHQYNVYKIHSCHCMCQCFLLFIAE